MLLNPSVDWSAIAAALIGIVPATLAALAGIWARGARSEAAAARVQATAANQAVNDVGPGEPKLREMVSDTNSAVLGLQGQVMHLNDSLSGLQSEVRNIQADRSAEARERLTRQASHDRDHASTREALARIDARLAAYAPVVEQWIATHPEIRPTDALDPDDDGGQT